MGFVVESKSVRKELVDKAKYDLRQSDYVVIKEIEKFLFEQGKLSKEFIQSREELREFIRSNNT